MSVTQIFHMRKTQRKEKQKGCVILMASLNAVVVYFVWLDFVHSMNVCGLGHYRPPEHQQEGKITKIVTMLYMFHIL